MRWLLISAAGECPPRHEARLWHARQREYADAAPEHYVPDDEAKEPEPEAEAEEETG